MFFSAAATYLEDLMNSIKIVRRVFVSAMVGALAVGSTAPSFAADSVAVPSITVKFGDLNVASPEGASALYGRIRMAAKEVCSPLSARDLASQARMGACVHKAIADAVTKVNQPALFLVYNQHNKTPLPAALLSQTR
jgi:UrcA family protein